MELTADQIQEWVLEGAPEDPARGVGECFVRGPLGKRHQSRLYYAECAAFPTPMCVKVCLVPNTLDPNPAAARRQYDALIRMGRVMGDGAEFSVPRPLLLRADVGLLAMQWIPGPTMTRSLFNWRCGPAGARQMMARAGRWLRRFHDGHELTRGRFRTAGNLRIVSEMERAGTVRDPVFSRALVQLRDSAEAAGAVCVNHGWLHGDFTTHNLILWGSRTVGIDFELQNDNIPVLFDLATFLFNLERTLLNPRACLLAGSGATLRQAFVRSYLDGSEDAIELPLAWQLLFMVLRRWGDLRAHASWPRSAMIDFHHRLVASRVAGRMGRLPRSGRAA